MTRNTLGLVSEKGTYAFVQSAPLEEALKTAKLNAYRQAKDKASEVGVTPMYLCTSDGAGCFCLPHPEFVANSPSSKRVPWDGSVDALQRVVREVEEAFPAADVVYAAGSYTILEKKKVETNAFVLSSWALILWQRNHPANQPVALTLFGTIVED